MEAVLEKTVTAPTAYRYRWVALFVILAVEVMDLLDALVTNIAGPSIRTELGGAYSLIKWLGAAYTLAMAIGLLTGGRLGDIFGRKSVFITGVLGFTLASLWCGLADSATMLIIARAVQGATAALMVPQVLATIHLLFADNSRDRAFAIYGIVLGLAGAAGFLQLQKVAQAFHIAPGPGQVLRVGEIGGLDLHAGGAGFRGEIAEKGFDAERSLLKRVCFCLKFLQCFRINFQAALAGKLMIHDRFRIIKLHVLGNPFFYVFHFWIKLLRLQVWIENSEIRCRITTATSSPLPVAIIRSQFKIEQLFREISFSPAPVDQ